MKLLRRASGASFCRELGEDAGNPLPVSGHGRAAPQEIAEVQAAGILKQATYDVGYKESLGAAAMNEHILLVDDDMLMRRSLTFGLERAGYKTTSAANAEDALQIARRELPDLVILDVNLPGMDGLKALQHFKERSNIPIILLTARRKDLDEILGLELGGDDYITKPVNLDVLLAHIKAVFRRMELTKPAPVTEAALAVGDLYLDPTGHTVSVAGQPVELTPREFDLLHTFALNPGRVISNEELLSRIWGAEFSGQPQVLYVHVRWLRKKIEADPDRPQRILTVHGVGYKLESHGQ
jgi:DNA-binding response OmpR family regulator